MRARDLQVCLVCLSRLFGQSCRLSLGGLMPMVAEELDLGPVQCASLLSAFPLGYMLMQVPGGTAADVFGARVVMAAVMVSTAGGTVLFAQLASFPAMWLAVFGMGLMQGPLFPVTGVVLSRWVPGSARSAPGPPRRRSLGTRSGPWWRCSWCPRPRRSWAGGRP
ncbi:unnamed protein product [Prorocentrum cordatum]|uniref:Major facilitator superfamily (MFS) profile domain-containing protein n=1 Tax=Prorocentrum cordatum TaxID=2364126 RepID=A0ABN9XRE4_9DINO|nr:unnamed protein product [Polarella glacialis]